MVKPALVVASSDDAMRDALTRDLTKRYGADYEVAAYPSGELALEHLAEQSSTDDVAVIFVDQHLPDIECLEFLTRARALRRRAKRVLLFRWHEFAIDRTVVDGMTFGVVDCAIATPWDPGDEHLYPHVGDMLSEWCRESPAPGFEAVRIIGERWSQRAFELRDALDRSAVPYGFYPHDSEEGQRLLRSVDQDGSRLPVVLVLDKVLADPPNSEIATALGVMTSPGGERYDLVILGAGPAGLSAAVYAASEGLRTLLVESEALGGQAGTSSKIKNYLGFPYGVSGHHLTAVATTQARFFGAELCYAKAHAMRADGREVVIASGDGEARARAVMLATGVRYRRLGIPACEALVGAGVYYGTAATEAPAMADRNVYVVGGGNSAGQAATNLAKYATHVTLLVREDALIFMSEYLVREIEAAGNISVRTSTEVVDGSGTGRLESLTVRDHATGKDEVVPADAVFILIGAQPDTEWLADCLERDEGGYIKTGRDLGPEDKNRWPLQRHPFHLETSLPGVFAAGDVRHGSVKRVASAVGEGGIAVQMVHNHLRELARDGSVHG